MEQEASHTEERQLSRRQLGLIVAAVSALVLLVSALAEPLGIGAGGGMGWKQYAGIAAGAVGLLVGLGIAFAPAQERSADGPQATVPDEQPPSSDAGAGAGRAD